MGRALLPFPTRAAVALTVCLSAWGCDSAASRPGDKGAGGSGGASGAPTGGASGTGGTSDVVPPGGGDAAPGTAAYELTSPGQGPCAGQSLEQVIAAVHTTWPDLADVKILYTVDPNRGGDGSFIYAFASPTGFALAFKRGGGDCPAGCTENEYWYFTTDAACAPTQAGHFKAFWGTGNCLATEGTPMWGLPRPPDPAVVCGSDNSARDISGVYTVNGTGTRTACTDKAGAEPQMNVTLALSLSVAQTTGDLSHGTVTVQGTGHPLIDGQPIAATFTRRRFTAMRDVSNLPAMCIDQNSIAINLDFESGTPGQLMFHETRSLDCPPSQTAYCKGQLNLALAIAK